MHAKQYSPSIEFTQKNGVGIVPREYWLNHCQRYEVPGNWVLYEGQRIVPDNVITGTPAARVILAGLIEPLAAARAPDPGQRALLEIARLAQAQGCAELAIPWLSPLDMFISPHAPETVPDDDTLVLATVRLIERGIEHGPLAHYPEELFTAEQPTRRMLVYAAFVGASMACYVSLHLRAQDASHLSARRAKQLNHRVLATMASAAGRRDERDAWSPRFTAVWNLLMQDRRDLITDAVRFMDRKRLLANLETPQVVDDVAVRLRVLIDVLTEQYLEHWLDIPGI